MTQQEFKEKLEHNYHLIEFKDGFIITGYPLVTIINWNQYEIWDKEKFIELRHPQTKAEITIFKDHQGIHVTFR